jgi:hypothetical protein
MFGWRGSAKAKALEDIANVVEAPAISEGFKFPYVNRLFDQMQQTSRSRFTAAKRLEQRDRKITRLTGLSSAYLIALTVIPYFLKLPPTVADHVNLLSVVMAVVVLVSSLLQYSRADATSSEQMHRSALEISELIRELISEPADVGRDVYLSYSRRYSTLLHKYSLNHDDLDYKFMQLERPHEHTWMDEKYKKTTRRQIFWDRRTPDVVLWVISLVLLALLLVYILPSQSAVPEKNLSSGTEASPSKFA